MSAILCTADMTLACSNGKARYILVDSKNELHSSAAMTTAELEASIVAQLKVLTAMTASPGAVLSRVTLAVETALAEDARFEEALSDAP